MNDNLKIHNKEDELNNSEEISKESIVEKQKKEVLNRAVSDNFFTAKCITRFANTKLL